MFLFFIKRYDDEEPKYDYDNPGFSSETGHFTQVRIIAITKVKECLFLFRPGMIAYNLKLSK